MADENGGGDQGNNGNGESTDGEKVSNAEIKALLRAQKEEIDRLRTENKNLKLENDNKSSIEEQVAELQKTLGTTKAMGELVDELKALRAAEGGGSGDNELSDLEKAAEAGDMKSYRKIRQQQIEESRPRGPRFG